MNDQLYMNPHTGHVCTLDEWYPYTLEDSFLLPVIWDEGAECWVEIED